MNRELVHQTIMNFFKLIPQYHDIIVLGVKEITEFVNSTLCINLPGAFEELKLICNLLSANNWKFNF